MPSDVSSNDIHWKEAVRNLSTQSQLFASSFLEGLDLPCEQDLGDRLASRASHGVERAATAAGRPGESQRESQCLCMERGALISRLR
ncbi:unnamed protein product [Merluccius merluccius]